MCCVLPFVPCSLLGSGRCAHRVLTVLPHTRAVVVSIQKYAGGWKRYDQAYGLWNPRKLQTLDKLVEKEPSCVYFDTRLAAFSKLATSVQEQAVRCAVLLLLLLLLFLVVVVVVLLLLLILLAWSSFPSPTTPCRALSCGHVVIPHPPLLLRCGLPLFPVRWRRTLTSCA